MVEESSSSSSTENVTNNDCIELDIPIFIELKQSNVTNDLGVYSRINIGVDQFIGNFKGKHRKSMTQCIDSNYVWTILSSRQIPLFYIDATDPNDSNWLRFIRSTNDPNKYNIICMQQNQQINYFTFKDIKEGEELLTYLPGKKKKTKNRLYHNLSYKLYDESKCETETEVSNEPLSENNESEKTTLEQIAEENGEDKEDEDIEGEEEERVRGRGRGRRREIEGGEGEGEEEGGEENDDNDNDDDNDIELKILNDEIKKKDDYFFSFNFSLKLKSNKKPLRRQLVKCDLCPYAIIVDSNYDHDRIMKSHIIDEHLTLVKDDEHKPIENIVADLCDSLVKQIENTCENENTFEFYFKFNSNEPKFDLLNNSLKCSYCQDEIDQIDYDNILIYFNHLLKVHKNQIVEDKLLVSELENISEHDIEYINWSDYFRLSFKDGKFPSDKSKTIKTWTCQMCKKQFEQRIDLSKHQCIELNLKLLKKKKELRKKKWKETHWKRKIDLSHIETTSLTQISSNICDNLTFCVDGTLQDLKSYSKEVKDYINTELTNETKNQMILKCCFPDIYKKLINEIPNINDTNASRLIDEHLIKKSIHYFTNNLTCKKCNIKFTKLIDYLDHERSIHENYDIKTAYETSNSPIGFFSCDPLAYLLNLHWDQTVRSKCSNCSEEFARGELIEHRCGPESVDHDDGDDENDNDDDDDDDNDNDVDGDDKNIDEHVELASQVVDELVEELKLNKRRKRVANDSLPDEVNFKAKRLLHEKPIETSKNIRRSARKSNSSLCSSSSSTQISPAKYSNDDNRSSTRTRSTRTRTELKDEIKNEPKAERIEPKQKIELPNEEKSPVKKELKTDLMSIKFVNNRKIHVCDKCGLEFTSGNSVSRHQEKSCLRIKVINIEFKSRSNKSGEIKKKCPICGAIFTNTHQLSIHIYRQHKSLLGSAHEPAAHEANRLSEEQLNRTLNDESEILDDDDNQSWILNESSTDLSSSATDTPSKKKKLLNSTV